MVVYQHTRQDDLGINLRFVLLGDAVNNEVNSSSQINAREVGKYIVQAWKTN